MTKPAPYPSDTRARGWRFELDHDRIEQSDTWVLAKPEIRPWLLMLWMVAWRQTPCGTLPDDDDLIVARLGIDRAVFDKNRAVLMRGWWPAGDGRLYHNVLVERVLEMLGYKEKEKARKAAYRAKMAGANVPKMSRGTTVGQPCDNQGTDTGRDATGTGTGTKTKEKTIAPPVRSLSTSHARPDVSHGTYADTQPTPGEACKAMRAKGLAAVNPSHPTLLALLDKGMTIEELESAAEDAVAKHKPFAYALATAEGRRRDSESIRHLPPSATRKNPTEPAWRALERIRMQQAVPGIAERSPSDPPTTIDVEARHVADTPAARLG